MGLLGDMAKKYSGKFSEIKKNVYSSNLGQYVKNAKEYAVDNVKQSAKIVGYKAPVAGAGIGWGAGIYAAGSLAKIAALVAAGTSLSAVTLPAFAFVSGAAAVGAGGGILYKVAKHTIQERKNSKNAEVEHPENNYRNAETDLKNLLDLNENQQKLKNYNATKEGKRVTASAGKLAQIYQKLIHQNEDVYNRTFAHKNAIADLKKAIGCGSEKTDPKAFEHYKEQGKGTSNGSIYATSNKPSGKVTLNNGRQTSENELYAALGHGKKQDVNKKPLSKQTLNELMGHKNTLNGKYSGVSDEYGELIEKRGDAKHYQSKEEEDHQKKNEYNKAVKDIAWSAKMAQRDSKNKVAYAERQDAYKKSVKDIAYSAKVAQRDSKNKAVYAERRREYDSTKEKLQGMRDLEALMKKGKSKSGSK